MKELSVLIVVLAVMWLFLTWIETNPLWSLTGWTVLGLWLTMYASRAAKR